MNATALVARAPIILTAQRRDIVVIGIVLVASAIFLLADARTAPIILWDESRNVVNALEMRRAGLGLVTTYGGAPDLWNTKPPLLIWLMAVSTMLFGPSEWALRLPSALAALGTLFLVMTFVRRATGSVATAVFAAGALLLSPGFFGEHGARTADYDSLLLFFVTAYLFLLFSVVHRARPAASTMVAAGLLIAGAVLTKSIAGLIPGAGVAVYLIATARLPRLWRSARYARMLVAALAPVLLFFLAREAVGPGYLAAAWRNDVVGRFSESLIGAQSPPWFYAEILYAGWFLAGALLLLLPIVFADVKGKARAALTYSLCIAGVSLVALSFASTKLLHYALPIFPLLAVAAAIIARAMAGKIAGAWARGSRPSAASGLLVLLCALLTANFAATAVHWRYRGFPERQFYTQAMYGSLFASLQRQGAHRIHVIDPGFVLEGVPHYAPLLRGYQLMWRDRGLDVRHHVDAGSVEGQRGVVASCDPLSADALRRRGPVMAEVEGCVAIRRPGGGQPAP